MKPSQKIVFIAMKQDILTSLSYLLESCEQTDCQSVLQLCLRLCKGRVEVEADLDIVYQPMNADNENFLAALAYLRDEAGNSEFKETFAILSAAYILCASLLHAPQILGDLYLPNI